MLRLLCTLAIVSSFLILSGCATGPVPGMLYTDVEVGQTATVYKQPTKRGEACASSILGLVATGDASINTSRKNGGIVQISTVEVTHWSILGLYTKYCTIVHGT